MDKHTEEKLIKLGKDLMGYACEAGKQYQDTLEIAYQYKSRAYRDAASRIRKILEKGFGLQERVEDANAQ